MCEGDVFRYRVCFDASRIHEESLDLYDGKKDRNLLPAISKDDGTVHVVSRPGGQRGKECEIEALATVGPRPNQLFLAMAVDRNDPDGQGPHIRRAVEWFRSGLDVIMPNWRDAVSSHWK